MSGTEDMPFWEHASEARRWYAAERHARLPESLDRARRVITVAVREGLIDPADIFIDRVGQ